MSLRIPAIADVRVAEPIIRQHVSPAPLIRSYALEKELQLPPTRRVWLKDYGWTPAGSFKRLGALNWMANSLARIGARPVAAHSEVKRNWSQPEFPPSNSLRASVRHSDSNSADVTDASMHCCD